MRNRFMLTVATIMGCSILFVSCSKEKIQPKPAASQKSVTSDTKSSESTTTPYSEAHTTSGGCSHGG